MKPLYLMVHCSATPEFRDYTKKQILAWFTSRGWRYPGYRQIAHLDGRITVLREYDHDDFIQNDEITNGAKGWNNRTIHISYIGGVDAKTGEPKDTRTEEQYFSLQAQTKFFMFMYPNIKILGHNQVAAKACPSFNVPRWLRDIGVPQKNIYNATPKDLRNIITCDGHTPPHELFDIDHEEEILNSIILNER